MVENYTVLLKMLQFFRKTSVCLKICFSFDRVRLINARLSGNGISIKCALRPLKVHFQPSAPYREAYF